MIILFNEAQLYGHILCHSALMWLLYETFTRPCRCVCNHSINTRIFRLLLYKYDTVYHFQMVWLLSNIYWAIRCIQFNIHCLLAKQYFGYSAKKLKLCITSFILSSKDNKRVIIIIMKWNHERVIIIIIKIQNLT